MITVETTTPQGRAITKEFYSARGAWTYLRGKRLALPDGEPVLGFRFFEMFGDKVARNAEHFTNKHGDKVFIKKS